MTDTTHFQTTLVQEATFTNTLGRFMEMDECMKKMIANMEALQWEDKILR